MGFDWQTLINIGGIAGGITGFAAYIRARGQNTADIGNMLVSQIKALQERNKDLAARIDILQSNAVENARLQFQIEQLADRVSVAQLAGNKRTEKITALELSILGLQLKAADLETKNSDCQKMLEGQQAIIKKLQQVHDAMDSRNADVAENTAATEANTAQRQDDALAQLQTAAVAQQHFEATNERIDAVPGQTADLVDERTRTPRGEEGG